MTRTQAKSKADAIQELSSNLERYESKFYNLITGSGNSDVERGVEISPVRSEAQALQHGQEDQLDHILGTATHLKELGYEINEEIGVHVRLLEEIDAREDELLAKQKMNDKLLSDWIKSKNSPLTWIWTLVAFLFVTLLYVLMW